MEEVEGIRNHNKSVSHSGLIRDLKARGELSCWLARLLTHTIKSRALRRNQQRVSVFYNATTIIIIFFFFLLLIPSRLLVVSRITQQQTTSLLIPIPIPPNVYNYFRCPEAAQTIFRVLCSSWITLAP
jgi:hypothetical protein